MDDVELILFPFRSIVEDETQRLPLKLGHKHLSVGTSGVELAGEAL